jgi:hypothetical protein
MRGGRELGPRLERAPAMLARRPLWRSTPSLRSSGNPLRSCSPRRSGAAAATAPSPAAPASGDPQPSPSEASWRRGDRRFGSAGVIVRSRSVSERRRLRSLRSTAVRDVCSYCLFSQDRYCRRRCRQARHHVPRLLTIVSLGASFELDRQLWIGGTQQLRQSRSAAIHVIKPFVSTRLLHYL